MEARIARKFVWARQEVTQWLGTTLMGGFLMQNCQAGLGCLMLVGRDGRRRWAHDTLRNLVGGGGRTSRRRSGACGLAARQQRLRTGTCCSASLEAALSMEAVDLQNRGKSRWVGPPLW